MGGACLDRSRRSSFRTDSYPAYTLLSYSMIFSRLDDPSAGEPRLRRCLLRRDVLDDIASADRDGDHLHRRLQAIDTGLTRPLKGADSGIY